MHGEVGVADSVEAGVAPDALLVCRPLTGGKKAVEADQTSAREAVDDIALDEVVVERGPAQIAVHGEEAAESVERLGVRGDFPIDLRSCRHDQFFESLAPENRDLVPGRRSGYACDRQAEGEHRHREGSHPPV